MPMRAHGGQAPLAPTLREQDVRRSQQANALITSKIKATTTWEAGFEVFCQYSDVFNAVNISALLHHTAKMVTKASGSGGGSVLQGMQRTERNDLLAAACELREFAEAELPLFGHREMANTAWALSRLGLLSRRFTQLVIARSQPKSFNEQELSNVLWALANAGRPPADRAWLRACTWELAHRAPAMKSQELCIALWSLAKLRLSPGSACLAALVSEAAARAPFLYGQDISNVLWAVATLEYSPPAPQLQQLLDACAAKAHHMLPSELSTVLWAASHGQWPVTELWVETLCAALTRPAGTRHKQAATASTQAPQEPGRPASLASPHDTSMALQALSKLPCSVPHASVNQLVKAFFASLKQSSSQDVVSFICGVAKLGCQLPQQAVDRLLSRATRLVGARDMAPAQVAGLMVACATLRLAIPEQLLRAVSLHLYARLEEYGPQELANTLWALARMRLHLSARLLSMALTALVGLDPAAAAAAGLAGAGGQGGQPVAQPSFSVALQPADEGAGDEEDAAAGAGAAALALSTPLPARALQATGSSTPPALPHPPPAPRSSSPSAFTHAHPPAPVSHQHIANTLWAIVWLLPPGQRFAFGHHCAKQLAVAEQLVQQHLRPDLEPGAGEVQPLLATPLKPCPAELLQVVQAFLALGYQPTKTWVVVHQWEAAKQWHLLGAAQQRRLARCYRALARGRARGGHLGLAAAPECGDAPCCVLPSSS